MEVSGSLSSMASLASPSLLEMSLPQSGSKPAEAKAAAGKVIETMFLSILLKSMRESGLGEGLFAGDKSDSMGAMFDQYMSDHLAAQGGLGIGATFADQAIRESSS